MAASSSCVAGVAFSDPSAAGDDSAVLLGGWVAVVVSEVAVEVAVAE